MRDVGTGGDGRQSDSLELFVIGAGWYALEIAEWAQDAGLAITGLVELLDPDRIGTRHGGHLIVDSDTLPHRAWVVVAGGGDRREHWALAEGRGAQAATVVHPTAYVSASATIGAGAIVGPMAVIGAGSTIGPHAVLSRGALVGHHVEIASFVRLLPGANVAGHVTIGSGATVGMSAAIADHTSVGDDATVAAAAMVLGDVPAGTRVQGVPAREHRA